MAPSGLADGAAKPVPLKVLIVGAGIGGLTAAIGLRRQGHDVTVYEQSQFASEHGAAIHIAPNANGILKRMGINMADDGAVETEWFTEYKADGELVKSIPVWKSKGMWQHAWLLAHRVHLHNRLKAEATALEGIGRPVTLCTSSHVLDVDSETATIMLRGGHMVTGDVVVGADGVHSNMRSKISSTRPFPSGKSAYRFLLPREAALKSSEASELIKRSGELIVWFAKDRRIVMYPTKFNELLNFVCIHPDTDSEASSSEWNKTGDQVKMMEVFREFDSRPLALMRMADPSTVKLWKLLDMEVLPKWTTGRLCLLGDAAHPFLPHQGQGGGCAIEDAASLSVVLPLGTTPEEIPERLQLYQDCRKERADRIQEFTRIAGKDLVPGAGDNSQQVLQFTAYNYGHDEFDHSTQKFREFQYYKAPDLCFRIPIAFGPIPGPRLAFPRQSHDTSNPRYLTTSIKIKTSRTLLQNLLPSKSFSFISPATVALASFSQKTLSQSNRFRGGGYSHFGLYIHGIQYKKRDGKVLTGTYLAVLFENLADPLFNGREELGMPKIFCDIETQRDGQSFNMTAAWKGTPFATLQLEDLQESEPIANPKGATPKESEEENLFVYGYIPTIGRNGKAEIECCHCIPQKKPKMQPESYRRTLKGQVKFNTTDWHSAPTLHHVVERLGELPILEMVEGTVVSGPGTIDSGGAYVVEQVG